jgi:hypothetical protein
MSQFLSWVNVVAGFILFFAMSGITNWVMFSSPEARIFPFLIGILLLANAVYLAFGSEASWVRRR